MARVKARGNVSTEQAVAKALRREHITGWRRHAKLPGSPDFLFGKERLALFVHGCFWHGCSKCHRTPRSRKSFWIAKIEENQARDRRILRRLRALGYRTMTVWEHELTQVTWIVRLRSRLERDDSKRGGAL